MDAWVWSLILLAVGLIVIGIEMFVPSGGVLGVLSAMAIVAAIVLAFVSSLKFGAVMLILVSFLLPIIFAAAIKYWPDTPMGRLIMIRPPSSDEVLPDAEGRRNLKSLIGRRGIAKCQMLPGGVVMVDGSNYDAVTDGTPVDSGQAVQVIAVRMNRLEVRLDDRPDHDPARDSQTKAQPLTAGESATVANAPTQTSSEDVLSRPIESLGLESLDDPLA